MRSVFFIITNECNSNCKYCFYNTGHEERKNIEYNSHSTNLFLDRLKELKFNQIIITGGEPLATKKLTKQSLVFIKKALAKGFKINFSTNGIGITPSLAKDLAKLKIDNLFISLDSHIREVHNSQRQGYDSTLRGIKLLISKGVKNLAINVVLTKNNYIQIKEIYKFLVHLGVRRVIFQPAFIPKENQLYSQLSIMDLPLSKRKKMVLDLEKVTENKNYFQLLKAFLLEKNTRLDQSCKMGKSFFVTSFDGELSTCFHTERKIGNIFNDSVNHLEKEIKSFKSPNIPECFGFHCLSLYNINSFWKSK